MTLLIEKGCHNHIPVNTQGHITFGWHKTEIHDRTHTDYETNLQRTCSARFKIWCKGVSRKTEKLIKKEKLCAVNKRQKMYKWMSELFDCSRYFFPYFLSVLSTSHVFILMQKCARACLYLCVCVLSKRSPLLASGRW